MTDSLVHIYIMHVSLQDEITEMKRKLKIMNHQIDQLKEEISAKEASLVKERTDHQRVEKEKEGLKAELQRYVLHFIYILCHTVCSFVSLFIYFYFFKYHLSQAQFVGVLGKPRIYIVHGQVFL